MKKTVSAVLVCVMLVCTLFALTSCGKTISGKYKSEIDMGFAAMSTTYEFDIFGKVVRTTNSLGSEKTVEGKYEFIEDDTKVTLTFPEEDPATYDFSSGEEDGVKYIKLDGIKFTKVD